MSFLQRHVLFVVMFATAAVCAERFVPQSDTSYIDEHGTAHITRVVPIPKTISPEAVKRRVNLHLVFVHAGVDAHLIVFDGLPHAFWTNFRLPESVEPARWWPSFLISTWGSE
jgi:hypothetical protein